MATNITMDTDWGAKGAQLTGAQVQAFIKEQLTSHKTSIDKLNGLITPHVNVLVRRNLAKYVIPPTAVNSTDTVEGIVIYSDHYMPIVIATQSKYLKWHINTTLRIGEALTTYQQIMGDTDGKASTQKIKGTQDMTGDKDTSAVAYACCYSSTSISAGKWWLPSMKELSIIANNIEEINSCIQTVIAKGTADFSYNVLFGIYWSVDEYDGQKAWQIQFAQPRIGQVATRMYNAKTGQANVLPVTSLDGVLQA